MSYAATAQEENEDRYYTQVDAGDVRLFTLDQLDAAFNAGLIHEHTYVCLEGDSTWLTLAQVAGLGEEEPVSAPIPAAPSVAAPPAPQYQSYAAPAPVAAASTPYGMQSSVPYSVAPTVLTGSTLAPISGDLSFNDDDMFAMKPKRRLGKIIGGVAVLGLAGLGFAVVQSGGIRMPSASGAEHAAAAGLTMSKVSEAATPKAQETAPTPMEEKKPEAPKAEEPKVEEPKAATAEGTSAKKGNDRFSEDMKAALLAKDQKQASVQKTKKTARTVAAKSRGGSSTKSAPALKSGGSAYDPLNGKL